MRSAFFVALWVLILPTAATAHETIETHSFAILRNDDPIGTSTITIRCEGPDTLVAISTSIAVKIGFLTLYRFDQRENEHWIDRHFVSMKSTTDDDGTIHRISVAASGAALTVTADGETARVAADLLPSSLWNVALAQRTAALSTVDGKPMRVIVSDLGVHDLPIGGHQVAAHHYSLRGVYSQDVWYDRRGNLVKLQLRGSDGSLITYQPVAP